MERKKTLIIFNIDMNALKKISSRNLIQQYARAHDGWVIIKNI